jgi:hypothetical protein
MERGMNFRIRRGVVPLPSAMALGATRSEEDARFTGEVTAREGRALGVHWAFAPGRGRQQQSREPDHQRALVRRGPGLVGRMTAAFVAVRTPGASWPRSSTTRATATPRRTATSSSPPSAAIASGWTASSCARFATPSPPAWTP